MVEAIKLIAKDAGITDKSWCQNQASMLSHNEIGTVGDLRALSLAFVKNLGRCSVLSAYLEGIYSDRL